MGFSEEWNRQYMDNRQMSLWPWSDLVRMVSKYGNTGKGSKVLEVGCGAGANIPYFAQASCEYYGIEGSQFIVEKLNERFKNGNVTVVQGDFTKDIPFEMEFDLIADRGAITHNSTEDIRKALSLIYSHLKTGGVFIGIDWHSVKQDYFKDGKDEYETVDSYTRRFSTGYYSNMGNTHFSDLNHIRELLHDFCIEEIYEKVRHRYVPDEEIFAGWDFVARKKPL